MSNSLGKIDPSTLTKPQLSLDCKNPKYREMFTGNTLETPRKIYDLFPFSHELSHLEGRLFELNDTVDMFLLLEGTHTHRGIRKPLFIAKHWDRFEDFQDKIWHVIDDDRDQRHFEKNATVNKPVWGIEKRMRQQLWEAFKSATRGVYSDNDMIIHGDLDEIPKREDVFHLKHCQLRPTYDHLCFGSMWFQYSFHTIYEGRQLQMRPGTAHLPNVFLLGKMRGREGLFRSQREPMIPRSGVHINRFTATPCEYFYKILNMAEGGGINMDLIEGGVSKFLERFWVKREYNDLVLKAPPASADEYIPWLFKAMPERFPYFWMTPEKAKELIEEISKFQY